MKPVLPFDNVWDQAATEKLAQLITTVEFELHESDEGFGFSCTQSENAPPDLLLVEYPVGAGESRAEALADWLSDVLEMFRKIDEQTDSDKRLLRRVFGQ